MAGGYQSYTMAEGDEYQEQDVWAVMSETKYHSPNITKSKESHVSSLPRHHLPAAAKTISRAQKNGSTEGVRGVQQSVPMSIPDWSKIYRKSGFESGLSDHAHDHGDGYSDGEEDDEEGRVPPHEWIAKKLSRSQISSFSVCEGAGRTLKGRDISKVRNVVLSRTGFLE